MCWFLVSNFFSSRRKVCGVNFLFRNWADILSIIFQWFLNLISVLIAKSWCFSGFWEKWIVCTCFILKISVLLKVLLWGNGFNYYGSFSFEGFWRIIKNPEKNPPKLCISSTNLVGIQLRYSDRIEFLEFCVSGLPPRFTISVTPIQIRLRNSTLSVKIP